MNIKVEFQPLSPFQALDTGELWHDMPISFTIPGSTQALITIPDTWTEQDINTWIAPYAAELVDDGRGPSEHPYWRYEHIDYFPLGFIPPTMFADPLYVVGDTFPLHGLTAAVRALGNMGRGIKIGVCDTGVDANHPAFSGGATVFGEGKNKDTHGHGTHCASTAASAIGIANEAIIYAGHALPYAGGGGSEQTVAQSIRNAVDFGCTIISLSLGGGASSVMDSACEYAKSKGAVVFAAAGNSGGVPQPGSPVRAADIMVMACDRNGQRAGFTDGWNWPFSNRAYFNGVQIRAARAGTADTVEMSGTSMACPTAAGAGGILAGAGKSRQDIISYLLMHRNASPDGLRCVLAADFGSTPPPVVPPAPGTPKATNIRVFYDGDPLKFKNFDINW